MRVLCAAIVVGCVVCAGAAAHAERFEGAVLERDSDRPLARVVVAIVDLAVTAVTDDNGRFAFAEVAPGVHHLQLRRGDEAVDVDETITAGTVEHVTYRLSREAQRFESTVRGRLQRDAVETQITVEEARHTAGTQGDALKVLQDLPGVARAAFGQGQLIVWGAAPADTRIYVDDVEVPLLYHLGGFRSTVNEGLVSNIDFVPGGQGAAFGRSLGGLVRLETKPPNATGVHGSIGADVLDASALIEAALGSRVNLTIAGRYSYLDKILAGLVSPNVGDYVPIPRWDDYQLKASVRLRAGESLSLMFLGADDRLDRALPSSDPALIRRERDQQSFYRASLRYLRSGADSTVSATLFVGWDHSSVSQEFGETPTTLSDDAWRYGLRAHDRRKLARWAWLSIGADVMGTSATVARVGSLTLPPREGDIYVFGQPPAGDVSAERFTIHQLDAAPYIEGEFAAGPVTFVPGVRVDAVLLEGNHLSPPSPTSPVPGFSRLDWAVEPRLRVAWRAHHRVTVAAAAGLYHQPPDPADLSAVFGHPSLGLQRAWHLTASLSVTATDFLSIDAAGFVKWLDDLVTRSPLPSPPVGKALVQDGTGFVYGGQLLVRARAWRGLSGWLSYTLSRSERRDHPTSTVRLFDYDQTHVLSLVANYQIRGFSAGARLRWSSGFPRTPVIGAFWDARDDQYQPLFGAQNSIRLPDFVQLDLRVEYAFHWRRAGLDLYLDVENVSNRKNAEELAYREDYSNASHPGYVTGLPTTAVLGARVRF